MELDVTAGSLPEVFQKAGLALTALFVDSSGVQSGGIRERVRAQGRDKEDLLARWLEQVLFLADAQQMHFSRFHVLSFSETSIEAEGEGELFDPGRHRLLRAAKALAPHGVQVRKTSADWEARVVLGAPS